MGRRGMGDASRSSGTGRKKSSQGARLGGYLRPLGDDEGGLEGVGGRKPKPFPFPVGTVIGELTVLEWRRCVTPSGMVAWHPIVRCSCGATGAVARENLVKGKTTRCRECGRKVADATRKKYWGYAEIIPDDAHRQRLLDRISAIIGRCKAGNKKTAAKHYALRGISVYSKWATGVAGRRAFLQYLITLPGWDNPELEIDRIDNNGNYEPGNLRFISRSENSKNRRHVGELHEELHDLRHRLQRAEEQIHSCDRCRANYCP